MKKSILFLFSLSLLTAVTSTALAASNLVITPVHLFPVILGNNKSSTAEYKVTNRGNVTLYSIKVSKLPRFVDLTAPSHKPQCKSTTPLGSRASCYFGLKIDSMPADSSVKPSDNMPAISANDGTYISYPVIDEQRLNVSAVALSSKVTANVSKGLPSNIIAGSTHAVTVVFSNKEQHAITNRSPVRNGASPR